MSTNGNGTRGQRINFASKREVRRVDIPEMKGEPLYIRSLSMAQLATLRGQDETGMKQLACALCDEHGTQLYDPESADDLKELGEISMPIFRAVTQALNELHGITVTKDQVDEAKKNSKTIPKATSDSA